ncbi:hypothetical protein X551_04721 [Methylibium sp. T29]|nr:hypothetical protein X551_04721 [Methylibium sp. T29]
MLPPFAGPGLGGHLLGCVLEAVGRIAGNDVEAPGLLAGLGVIGSDVAARRTILGAAIADQYLTAEDLGISADVHRLIDVGGLDAPLLRSVLRVEADQAAVIGGDDQRALPKPDAARATPEEAQALAGVLDGLGVILPENFAGLGIDSSCHAVRTGKVQNAIDDKWRAEKCSVIGQWQLPCEIEPRDVLGVDLV